MLVGPTASAAGQHRPPVNPDPKPMPPKPVSGVAPEVKTPAAKAFVMTVSDDSSAGEALSASLQQRAEAEVGLPSGLQANDTPTAL